MSNGYFCHLVAGPKHLVAPKMANVKNVCMSMPIKTNKTLSDEPIYIVLKMYINISLIHVFSPDCKWHNKHQFASCDVTPVIQSFNITVLVHLGTLSILEWPAVFSDWITSVQDLQFVYLCFFLLRGALNIHGLKQMENTQACAAVPFITLDSSGF